MLNDPIVEEMRKNGQVFVTRYKNDLAAICKALKEVEQASGHKLITGKPQQLPTKKVAN